MTITSRPYSKTKQPLPARAGGLRNGSRGLQPGGAQLVRTHMTNNIDDFTLAQGFRAAATACGLKTSSVMGASSLDLALVVSEGPCAAAGVFTTNRVKAAPVLYDQEVLARNA